LTTIAAAIAALSVLLFAAPAAQAIDIIEAQHNPPTAEDGWQAGTCTTDLPPCSPETPAQFFTQAAGHPGVGLTQFIVKHSSGVLGAKTPVGNLKTLFVDLPVGLSVNPQATPQCDLPEGASPSTCPLATQVGSSTLEGAAVILGTGAPLALPAVPVYNIVPKQGEPARFGFSVLGNDVFLEAGVAWSSDFHEFFTIHVPQLKLPEIVGLEGVRVLRNRLTFEGRKGLIAGGGGAFLTNPSTCFDPSQPAFAHTYSTFLHADSVEEPAAQFPNGGQQVEAALPPGVKPTGCENVPFTPTAATAPNTTQTDSPFGPTVAVTVPFDPAAEIAQSNVRTARVTLPKGAGLNPASAKGLQACTDAQFGKGTTAPVSCPAGSRVGTVSIQTPVLPPNSLLGDVYLGQQLSRDPTSGDEYRVFIDAEAPRFGQSVRLVGNVSADPQTGQLTTTVSEAPQLPFTSVQIAFDGGKGVLTSPPTCGPNPTSHAMTAWSGTPDSGPQDPGFTLSTAPGGGACAKSLGERPFDPSFAAAPNNAKAATFTPFQAHIERGDGQQELKGVDITLPPGATAKLAGTPYCPPGAIAAAAGQSGADEKAHPSCPDQSQIGVAKVAAGSGPSPLEIDGKAYLAGPYKGAPLSMAVITPAVAGPFDLGTVVVRVALFLDPETAQIHAVSDAIPDVFGGAKLDIRSVDVNVNKKEFTLNGTNCSRFATTGALRGGGSDPTNEASFSSFGVSSPVQLSDCPPLAFKPKLNLRLFGATKRSKHPRLQAILRARGGDANIARAAVALPHALFLDQASLTTICTRVQFAANQCPKKSVYGRATATTPLLGKPLSGPVYLRSSSNPLPDLVAHLEGQVDIDLVGRIDSFHGGIRTTFDRVPDVPVSTFKMILPGGKHGLLVASRNLCQKPVKAIVRFKAQNGKKANKRPRLRTPCRVKKGRHGKGKHKGAPKNGPKGK